MPLSVRHVPHVPEFPFRVYAPAVHWPDARPLSEFDYVEDRVSKKEEHEEGKCYYKEHYNGPEVSRSIAGRHDHDDCVDTPPESEDPGDPGSGGEKITLHFSLPPQAVWLGL